MGRRAKQRSRSPIAPWRASTSVASQHAATFQYVDIAPSSASTSVASQHAATFQPPLEFSNELQDEVLQWTYQSFMETMQALHQQSTHTRPCLDRSRIQEMQRNTLSSTINTLHRAYAKLLREGAETGVSRDDLIATVRNLAVAIRHKFRTNRPENAAEAHDQLKHMLQNLKEEHVWRRVADVFRQAALQAAENAERAYERSQICRREITSLRQPVP